MRKKTLSLADDVIFDFKISCISGIYLLFILTLFMMGPFRTAHGWVAKRPSLPKICLTYPTIMQLGIVILHLKKIGKMFKWCATTLEFCWYHYFFTRNYQFLYIFFYFFWLLTYWFILIDIVTILMMPVKIAAPGYDVITFVHEVANKTLSGDSNGTVNVLMWPSFVFVFVFLFILRWYTMFIWKCRIVV